MDWGWNLPSSQWLGPATSHPAADCRARPGPFVYRGANAGAANTSSLPVPGQTLLQPPLSGACFCVCRCPPGHAAGRPASCCRATPARRPRRALQPTVCAGAAAHPARPGSCRCALAWVITGPRCWQRPVRDYHGRRRRVSRGALPSARSRSPPACCPLPLPHARSLSCHVRFAVDPDGRCTSAVAPRRPAGRTPAVVSKERPAAVRA